MKRALWVSIAFVLGCSGNGGGGAPPLTAALMPPGSEGLVMGSSTEAQVAAKFPGAQIEKDKSLGGSGVVTFNDHPVEIHRTDGATATLWADSAGALHLMRLALRGAGRCDWVKQTIAPLPGSTTCRGTNRVSGDRGHEMLYCLSTADETHRLWVECERNELQVGGARTDALELWVLDD